MDKDFRTGLSGGCVLGGVAGGRLGRGEPLYLAPVQIQVSLGSESCDGLVVPGRTWVCELKEGQFMLNMMVILREFVPVVIV